MNTKHFIAGLLLLACLFFCGLDLNAQNSPEQVVLTPEKVLQLGQSNSPLLKAAQARADVAEARYDANLAAQVPTIQLLSTYTRLSDNIEPFVINIPGVGEEPLNPQILNQYSNKLSAQQIIFAGNRAKNTFRASDYLRKAAVLDVEKDAMEVRQNLLSAFYAYHKLLLAQNAIRQNIEVSRGRKTDVDNAVKNGTAIEGDALRAAVNLEQLNWQLEELGNTIEAARFTLCTLLGLPEQTPLLIDENTLYASRDSRNLEALLSGAQNRPDLKAAELRLAANERNISIAKGSMLPVLSAGANLYYSNPNNRVFPQEAAFKSTWDAGLTLSWNLSNLYTARFQAQEAKANLQNNTALRSNLLDNTRNQIVTAYQALQSADSRIALSRRTVDMATEQQRVFKNRYDAGTATLTDLLEADAQLLAAQINLVTSRDDAELAYLKLRNAAGF